MDEIPDQKLQAWCGCIDLLEDQKKLSYPTDSHVFFFLSPSCQKTLPHFLLLP